jgi:hypothetical protein
VTINHPVSSAAAAKLERAHKALVAAGKAYRRAPADEADFETATARVEYRRQIGNYRTARMSLGLNPGEFPSPPQDGQEGPQDDPGSTS